MTKSRGLITLAIVAGVCGCTFAGRVGIIRKDILTDAQQVIADTKINAGDMTIEGSVDHADTSYKAGQPIAVSVKVSKDAHVAILSVLANGSTTLLFPNRKQPKADIPANTVLSVPGPGDAVTIAVDKPGVVLFEFIASTDKGSWLFDRAASEGSDFADLGATTRSLAKLITGSLKINKGPQTAATYLTVRITD